MIDGAPSGALSQWATAGATRQALAHSSCNDELDRRCIFVALTEPPSEAPPFLRSFRWPRSAHTLWLRARSADLAR